MKASILLTFVLAALLFTAASVKAEDIESVILSTEANCPDALVTSVAANKIGAPVLLTASDELSEESAAEIDAISPSTVYIVGGPAAVSESVEEELSVSYDVVRLWGMTRYGTAAEVALEFWESAPKVMLVWDVLGVPSSSNCELISEAKDLAIQENIPVLLIARNSIPDQVVDVLENLSAESAVLVGNLGSGVTDTLSELGISVEEEIKGINISATRALLRQKIRQKLLKRIERPFVIVAVGDWSDTIKAPYTPNGTSRLISSEDELEDLITEIDHNHYSNIKIVGKPDLAQRIYDRLRQYDIDAVLISGRPAAVAAAVLKRDLARIRKRARAVRASLLALCERKATGVQDEVEAVVERVRNFLGGVDIPADVKERWLNWLTEKRQSFDENFVNGSYCRAWNDYTVVKNKISELTYKYRNRLVTAYRRLVEKETRLMKAAEQLTAVRQRLAERLRANAAASESA